MKRRALALLFIFAFAFARADEPLQEVTVKQGDTLWGIARTYLEDPSRWPEILKHNNLPMNDPAVALPGMKLKVPVKLIKEHLRKADLVYLVNDVLYRRKSEPSWRSAFKGMDLYNEDGLRTMEDAEAHVKFYSGDVLKLARNSLVVLRPELQREEVNLLSGVLRTGRTKVITPTAEVNPRTSDTVYKARVRGDKATIVQVERGSTEVLGLASGKRVIVNEGFANITTSKRPPSEPVKVPPLEGFGIADFDENGKLIPPLTAKAPPAPPIDASDRRRAAPQKPKPEPERAAPQARPAPARKKVETYVIQVSKSPDFAPIAFEIEREVTPDVDVNDTSGFKLPDGKYFRRVLYIDKSGRAGGFTALAPFEVDTVAPNLTIFEPPDGYRTRESLVRMTGKTDPNGSILTVNGLPVEIKPDGSFTWSVVLANPGENRIRIVAKDLAGNKTEMLRTMVRK